MWFINELKNNITILDEINIKLFNMQIFMITKSYYLYLKCIQSYKLV